MPTSRKFFRVELTYPITRADRLRVIVLSEAQAEAEAAAGLKRKGDFLPRQIANDFVPACQRAFKGSRELLCVTFDGAPLSRVVRESAELEILELVRELYERVIFYPEIAS